MTVARASHAFMIVLDLRDTTQASFNAVKLNVIPLHKSINRKLHHGLRLGRLQAEHCPAGSRALPIASLAYDGGQR